MRFPRALLCALSVIAFARGAQGQLRPLEPLDPDFWFDAGNLRARVHVAWLDDQRASLAGTRGRLVELGDVGWFVRTGRIVLEFAGTPQRWFTEESRFATATGGAHASPADGKRHDAGDYRVGTSVRLAGLESRVIPVLRFGARLPTTDNMVGLDRDATDFFALIGGVAGSERWRVSGETGIGINGTRLPNYEQSDVLLYSFTVQYRAGVVLPFVTALGQEDLKDRGIRGNEDLGELRAGVRIGQARWLVVQGVLGYSTFSPRAGVIIGGGARFNWK